MLRRLLPLSLIALAACGDPNAVSLSSSQARVDVTLEPFAFTVRNADGDAVLSSLATGDGAYGPFAPTLDRPTYVDQLVPGWDGYRAGDGTWVRGGKAKLMSRSPTQVDVAWDLDGGQVWVTFLVSGPRVLVSMGVVGVDGAPPSVKYNKATVAFALPEDEHFFGLGERFASFDHRGQSLYSWAEEGALGGGEDTPVGPENPYPNGPSMTYFPVPFFHSSKGYALHLGTPFRSELHLGSERADAWRMAVNDRGLSFTVYVTDSPVTAIDLFTEDTGRPVVPAPWVFGPRRRLGRGSRVDGGLEYQVMRELKLPLTGIDDSVHFLPALSQTGIEAELRQWTQDAHAWGYKVMAYNNPFVAQNHPNAAADYAFGADAGYFVKDPDGEPALAFLISGSPLYVAMVDFTNPDASAWYRSLLQRTVDTGYDGWMHDFGEYVPRNARFFDGSRGDAMHNVYPVLSAYQARTVLEAAKPDDSLFFVRAGYTGTQKLAPAVWGGDAETSFDETQGIPSAARSGLNLALSGVPWWGSDGTGFKCITDALRDKDVYVRWVQLMAVSPIMMDQNACSNPLERRTKWTMWSDAESVEVWRQMASLHTRLLPYFQVAAREAHATGLPLMRPPFLFAPAEPRTWTLDDTYYFGPALYAAPVVRRGKTTREVWFPPGAKYVDLADFAVYEGGASVTVPAPMLKLPLFLVEGQLLPMLDADVQTLAPATEPGIVTRADRADVLDVQVALRPGGKASLELVDGTVLFAERTGDDVGTTGFSAVQPDALRACVSCVHEAAQGGVQRLRFSGQTLAASTRVRDVHVTTTSAKPLRVRWDVMRLP